MPEPSPPNPDRGVGESLRVAIEQTFERAAERARAGPAATRERAGELLDEVVQRGLKTRDELTRRGQEARGELTRRGQEARGELARRLELLEGRLAELEEALRRDSQPKSED